MGKISCLLTKEFLTSPNISSLKSREIDKIYNLYPGSTNMYRNKFNITTDKVLLRRKAKELRKLPIEDSLIGLIAGTIYGDAHLGKTSEGSIFLSIGHGSKQKAYIDFWKKLLQNLLIRDIYVWVDKNSGNHKSYSIRTISNHPDLIKLYSFFYDQSGKKIVTQEGLDLLTLPGFVLWFFDDGSRQGRRYLLSTCNFTLEENKLIRQHLFKRFGIKTTIIRTNNGKKRYWSLYFAKDTLPLFEEYLIRYKLPFFDYKIHPSALRSSETTRENLWNNYFINKI